jgi:uncharacterized membrane protein YedE/YeeE
MGVVLNAAAGLLFGLGLIISGMVNPAKVLNFLDPLGIFDPSLAFVMAGAVAVTFVGYRLVLRRPRPIFADRFRLPLAKDVDLRAVLGPAIFGVGWGLSGFCPGPAIASLPLLATGTLVFVPAMLAGMALSRLFTRTGQRATRAMPSGADKSRKGR